jgi:lipopolysaccharide transport system ATP-binding protein
MNAVEIEKLGKCYRLEKSSTGFYEKLNFLFRRNKDEKKYLERELWALKDIDLSVKKGRICGVIGRNGAGKTTLLKVLSRITPPTEGKAIIRGRVVSLLEVGAGFQPELNAVDNISLNAAIYGIGPREASRRVSDILNFADVEKFKAMPVKHYSSGMYLRLAFSTALNMLPDVLLADEVLAVGDGDFQNKCFERIKNAGQEGVTVLFVSHDMGAVERICDETIRLHDGKIVDRGAPLEVIERYQKDLWQISNNRLRDELGGHRSELGEIVAVDLVDSTKRQKGSVRSDETFLLRLIFKTYQHRPLKVRCAFDLKAKNCIVFRSVQPDVMLVSQSQVHTVYCEIPGCLLADIFYTVDTCVIFYDGDEEHYLTDYNSVSFSVYAPENTLQGSFRGRLTGVVRPSLKWSQEL